jgi:hypothetical protein
MSESGTKPAFDWGKERMELVFVTAEQARQFMHRNLPNNRPVNEKRVKDYKRDMANGKWHKNGETMKFSKEGFLIDGQHRCMASMEAGVGFWSWIAYGVDKDAFITIDRGQSRSAGQQIHLMTGISDYNAVAATIGHLYRFKDGIMLNDSLRPTSSEIEELLRSSPGITDSVAAAKAVIKRFPAGPTPLVAICHYLFTRQDATMAELFFESLASGASLREVDPVYQLRNRIIAARTHKSVHIAPYELMALFFKAWRAEKEQTTMRVLRWSIAESFPNIGIIESIGKMRPETKTNGSPGKRKPRTVAITPPPEAQPTTALDKLIQKHQGLDRRN